VALRGAMSRSVAIGRDTAAARARRIGALRARVTANLVAEPIDVRGARGISLGRGVGIIGKPANGVGRYPAAGGGRPAQGVQLYEDDGSHGGSREAKHAQHERVRFDWTLAGVTARWFRCPQFRPRGVRAYSTTLKRQRPLRGRKSALRNPAKTSSAATRP
jgi:hypothetical protein